MILFNLIFITPIPCTIIISNLSDMEKGREIKYNINQIQCMEKQIEKSIRLSGKLYNNGALYNYENLYDNE